MKEYNGKEEWLEHQKRKFRLENIEQVGRLQDLKPGLIIYDMGYWNRQWESFSFEILEVRYKGSAAIVKAKLLDRHNEIVWNDADADGILEWVFQDYHLNRYYIEV